MQLRNSIEGMDEIDVWRAAKLLVDMHGGDAAVGAARRLGELKSLQDHHGAAAWARIPPGNSCASTIVQ